MSVPNVPNPDESSDSRRPDEPAGPARELADELAAGSTADGSDASVRPGGPHGGVGRSPSSPADWRPVVERLLGLPAGGHDGATDRMRESVWQAVQAAARDAASSRRAHAERIAAEFNEPGWADEIERWLSVLPPTDIPEDLREPTWQAVDAAVANRVAATRALAAELMHDPADPADADEPSRHAPAAELADQAEWAALIDRVRMLPAAAPSYELRDRVWASAEEEREATATPSSGTAPAGGRVRWLRPASMTAAAVLMVALGAWALWSVFAPMPDPTPTDRIGRTALLPPTPPSADAAADSGFQPLRRDTTVRTGSQLGVVTTDAADYLIDADSELQFESADRVSLGDGQLAVCARRRVWIVTAHEQPVELEVVPDGEAAMAYIRINRRVDRVTPPDADGRVLVDCRMVSLNHALARVSTAAGTSMRLDSSDVAARMGRELISVTIHAESDQLPAVFGAVVESRFPVRFAATADGWELQPRDASGSRGASPDWVTVEARSGRVLVRTGEQELAATGDLHVRVRSAEFYASHGKAARIDRWPATAATRVHQHLLRLQDGTGDLDALDGTMTALTRVWADSRPDFRPTVSPIHRTDLGRYDGELEFQPDGSGNPGALLFTVGGGVKLLREGDDLDGWTIESIERRGMHLVNADGTRRTWLSFN